MHRSLASLKQKIKTLVVPQDLCTILEVPLNQDFVKLL